MDFQEDFHLEVSDIQSNIVVLKQAIDYLNNDKNGENIFKNKKARNAFGFIRQLTAYVYYHEMEKPAEIFIENSFHEVLINVIEYLVKMTNELTDNNNTIDLKSSVTPEYFKILTNTQDITNFLVSSNLNFRLEFFQKGGAKFLLNLLANKKFIDSFHSIPLFDTIIMNINWLSKDADQFKSEWLEINAVNILLPIATNYPICKLPAYMAVANIANDKQIETLKGLDAIISELIKYTKRTADNIGLNSGNVERDVQQFIEDDSPPTEYYVYYVVADGYKVQYSITGILLGLYRLSINNTIKYDLYVKHNLKTHLKVIISKGTIIEQKYSLQLLAQLCFDTQVLDIVSKDDELVKQIEFLIKPENCSMKSMRKLCEQIIWAISTKNKKINDESNKRLNEINQQQNQIMISYNSGSRDLCLKIKQALEANNFKVWIDINEIHGSSLEAMARAVESSDFILMCVTEKYRQSINCQAEAQYAFKLKKKIIPLVMQKGYENVDGWLGIIMGDKIFVNFTKYSFEQAVILMLKEINLSINNSITSDHTVSRTTVADVSSTSVTTNNMLFNSSLATTVPFLSNQFNQSAIQKWSEKDVEDWFKSKNICPDIFSIIKPCNGELLHQMYTLQISAPEFFYQSITKNNNIDLRTALVFALNLKKLFEQTQ